ncbi:MAG: thiolase [Chloroflexi bacterium HGW-Chloroflexi-5]|jgi:acetyl-CoA acetyltransferase|nr:MAG: thiolase [Deltaproteobacteria bacterium HGW-Deltaproteobacteria-12]PKN96719.1 MAG: thiolase [Chloroflexi bacterium HGW-Chloroflexi-5]
MKDVYIIGAYSTEFRKCPDLTFRDLTREAYLGAIKDAGMTNGDEIQFAYFGNCAMHLFGQVFGQGCIRGQICFIPLVREGLFPERVPMINVEGACATGSMAIHSGWKDILSGQSDVVLALGVEKLFIPEDPAKSMSIFEGGADNFSREETVDNYKELGKLVGQEFQTGPNRSFFMDTYGMQARYHMWKYGTTQRQLAQAASITHHHGALNPKAQLKIEMTPEQVLEDRLVSYPLTRAMCSPIGDGAAAVVMCSGDYLKNLPADVQRRAVKIKSSAFTGGKYKKYDEPSLCYVAAKKAYAMAGIKPEDVDVAEVHDATSFGIIYQAEMMGFCEIGQGGRFVESGAITLEGKIPINTSGGLVSKGHPVGATGISMISELTTQLRGEAGPRQVKNAEFAMQENGGGVIGTEEAACSVMILQKDR